MLSLSITLTPIYWWANSKTLVYQTDSLGGLSAFFMNRHQQVKIGQSMSSWVEIWGMVPKGTHLGVIFFLCMINDLRTECQAIKYVDDTTILHVTTRSSDLSMQQSVDTAIVRSESNSMRIHAAKTKEMVVCFAQSEPNVPNITVGTYNLSVSLIAA